MIENLAMGFGVAMTWQNLAWCMLGVTLGTAVGVLPGLGTVATISILLPLMYGTDNVVSAMIFMAGIYYGSQYGGSTTSILLRMPGEAASVITCLDGYAMNQRGRAGAALAISALASFVAGTVATLLIALLAGPASHVALLFGSAEYAALLALACLAAVALGQNGFWQGLGLATLGILLGLVGTDVNSGVPRFTGGVLELYDGIGFGILAMGVFGLGEIIYNYLHVRTTPAQVPKFRELYPNSQELRDSVAPTLRGTAVGSAVGILPGGGAVLASFLSYAVEKAVGHRLHRFGQGAVPGLAGPEAANNAAAQTGFIPMLSLGLPTNAVMALMLAGLIVNGVMPGPQVISQNPGLFWGLVASMWIGNLLLLALNLPLVGIWVRLLQIPRALLTVMILLICVYGAHSINNNWFDVAMLVPLTLLGYLLRRIGCDATPMAMGFVVGVMFEEHLRRALTISRGDWMTFIDRPISFNILCVAIIMLITVMIVRIRRAEKENNG